MKKFLTVLLIAVLTFTAAFALSACGSVAYDVTFNLKGGEVNGSADNVVVTTAKVTKGKVPNVARTGYDFLGWYASSDYSGEEITFPYEPDAKITLYAKWELKEGFIIYSFNVNGGTSVATVVSDGGIASSPQTTKTGHTLEGWYTDSDLTQKAEFPYDGGEGTTAVTFYAKWKINSYTITFDTAGGSAIAPITADYNQSISEPNGPVKENYAFGGWFTDEERTNPFTFKTMPASDTTLYAKWIGEAEGLEFTLSADGTYYVLKGIGSNKDAALYIPKEYQGKPVKAIKAGAFDNVSHITSLFIPSSVTLIDREALGGMRNLESLTLPFIGRSTSSTQAVELLFGYIFSGSYYKASAAIYQNYSDNEGDVLLSYLPQTLKNVTVTGSGITLGRAAFRGVKTVEKLSFEGNIASNEIAPYTFESMVALTTVKLPSTIETIKNNAFENCHSLSGFSLGDASSLNFIEANAYKNCFALKTFTLPAGVVTISDGAFENCRALVTFTVKNSSGIVSIGDRAFYGCEKLESLKTSQFLFKIGKEAFAHCYAFEGFTSGGSSAFLTLPSSLSSLGESAFNFCAALTSVTINIDNFALLPSSLFSNCRALTSVSFSSGGGIKEIGARAFENCVSLTTFTLKDAIETIGEGAFYGCTGLTTFNTNRTSNLKAVGGKAFYGCTALNKVVLPQSLTDMGGDVFVNCKKLANSGKGIHFWSAESANQTSSWDAKWNVVTHADEEKEIEEVKANLYFGYTE